MSPERFVLTEQHLALIRHMNVDWNDAESGAPTVDPNRPYGNSDVERDVLEVLGVAVQMDADDWDILPTQRDAAKSLHRETATALQIVLCTGSFVVGTYVKEDRYQDRSWRLDSAVKP